MRHLGLNVHDDREAAPENLPTNARTQEVAEVLQAQSWGWNQICNRAKLGIQNVGAHIKRRTSDYLSGLSRLDMFFVFSHPLIADVQDLTNQSLAKERLKEMSRSEFIMWIAIWLFMSTFSGFKRDDFWSSREITLEEGAPYQFHIG